MPADSPFPVLSYTSRRFSVADYHIFLLTSRHRYRNIWCVGERLRNFWRLLSAKGYTGTKSSKEELQYASKEKGCQEKEEKVTA
jgi:hypothetical protein